MCHIPKMFENGIAKINFYYKLINTLRTNISCPLGGFEINNELKTKKKLEK